MNLSGYTNPDGTFKSVVTPTKNTNTSKPQTTQHKHQDQYFNTITTLNDYGNSVPISNGTNL